MRLISVRIAGLKNQRAEYQLAPLTVLVGPNGAGKTSVLQAVRFGILGYEPSLGKSAEKLAPLMAANEMSVRLTGERNGAKVSVTRSLTYKNGKLSSGITVLPSEGDQKPEQLKARAAQEFGSFLAMLDLGDLMELSHDKRRAFLFGLAAQACDLTVEKVLDLTWASMEPERKTVEKEVWDRAIEFILSLKTDAVDKGAVDAHDVISLMLAGLKVKESEAAAEKKNRGAAIQSLTDELAGLSTVAATRAELEAEVRSLNEQVDAATRETEEAKAALTAWRGARSRQEAIAQQRGHLQASNAAELEAARAALASAQTKILATDGAIDQDRRTLQTLRTDLLSAQDARNQAVTVLNVHDAAVEATQALLEKIGRCESEENPWCALGQKRAFLAKDIEGRSLLTEAVGSTDRKASGLAIVVKDAEEALARSEQAGRSLHTEATTLARKVSGLETAAGQRTATLEALASEEASLSTILNAPPVTDVDVLEARTTALKHRRGAAQSQALAVARREAIEGSLAKSRGDMAKAEIDGAALKFVKVALGPKGLQGEVARLVIEPLVAAGDAVLKGLPAGKRLGLRTLSAKGDEVTEIGWARGEVLIRYETLSGGERIQFAAAIAAGLLELKKPPLRVLCIDDLQSVDAENRGPFLAALETLLHDGKLDNVLVACNTPVGISGSPERVRVHELHGEPAMAGA